MFQQLIEILSNNIINHQSKRSAQVLLQPPLARHIDIDHIDRYKCPEAGRTHKRRNFVFRQILHIMGLLDHRQSGDNLLAHRVIDCQSVQRLFGPSVESWR